MFNIGPLVLIDDHESIVIDVNPGSWKVETVTVGHPTHGIEDDVGRIVVVDPVTVNRQDHEVTTRITIDAHQALGHPQPHAVTNLIGEPLRDLLVLMTQHPPGPIDDSDAGSQRGEDMGELGGNESTTENHQTVGQLLQPHDGVGGVDRPRQARVVETEDIRDARARPCRQDDLVSSDASVPDLDGVGIDELRLVGVDVDVLQPLAVLKPTSRNGINASEDSVTNGGEGCPAELQPDPQLGCLGRRGRKVRREHEHLRRYAADIEAGTPESARVDDGGASVGKFLVQDRVS